MHQCTKFDMILTCVQFEHVAVSYHEVIGIKIMRRFSFFFNKIYMETPLSKLRKPLVYVTKSTKLSNTTS